MRKIKDIEEKILKIAVQIAKQGDGALFIIGNKIRYEKLVKHRLKQFSIFSKGAEKRLKRFAVVDGAIIIDRNGIVKEYGVMIKGAKPFKGYGTRHAAAFTASKNNNIALLCSEEEKKVKIFKNGKYIMQIDALEKGVEKYIQRIPTLLESLGAGVLTTIGAVTLAPSLGITFLPGVLIFGGSYLAIKRIMEKIKIKNKKKMKR